MTLFTGGDILNHLGLNHSGGRSGQSGQILNAAPPVVDHCHNVAEVQTFHHHLHKVLVAASTGHKLLQGEFACWRGQTFTGMEVSFSADMLLYIVIFTLLTGQS